MTDKKRRWKKEKEKGEEKKSLRGMHQRGAYRGVHLDDKVIFKIERIASSFGDSQ